MKKTSLFLLFALLGIIISCTWPFYAIHKIDGISYIAIRNTDSKNGINLIIFAGRRSEYSKRKIYTPENPEELYIFLGDSEEILKKLEIRSDIKDVILKGVSYCRYRFKISPKVDPYEYLDVFVKDGFIISMKAKVFNE